VELSTLGQEIGRETSAVLAETDVLLSTFARLAAWDELARLRFRSVVVDEASTSPLPYVALAAAQASHRAVAIGDFQQLPAVVSARTEVAERWMSRDPFREAGVVDDPVGGEIVLPGEHDRLCAMLVEQYRMAPSVRRLVSDLFYDGRLVDAAEVLERDLPARSLVLLDTTSLDPSVERVEGSRANAEHVEAVVRFLEAAAGAGLSDVGVVAPYRVQSRRIWKLARSRLGRAAPGDLEVSTIHRFQGREKRVVIFDTVDAPPDRSWFLHEGKNRDFPRLLNVALSRTRDMLVVAGSPEGLQQTLPENALLNRVVARIQRDGVVVDVKDEEALNGLFRAPAAV
jgi:superfamily I DNA and/or RNA helicase